MNEEDEILDSAPHLPRAYGWRIISTTSSKPAATASPSNINHQQGEPHIFFERARVQTQAELQSENMRCLNLSGTWAMIT